MTYFIIRTMATKIDNPIAFRSNIQKKLSAKLLDDYAAKKLERGIFNYAIKEATQRKIVKKWDNNQFVLIYVTHLRSIMNNLRDSIIEKINNKSLKPYHIAFMTHQELDADRWSSLIDAKTKRDKNKFEVNIAASTKTFKCRKCKGTNCTYYLMQTRSADEPMTCFVTCIDCGTRWKC